jgi:hypothetical protein
MFVDHSLWPPPPSEPPPPRPRRLTDAQERSIGWAALAFVVAMLLGPLAGSSVIIALVAAWHTLFG